MIIILLSSLLLVECLAALVWWVAYKIEKTSIVDIFWSLFILAAAGLYFFCLQPQPRASGFYLLLLTFWAARLSLFIYFRAKGHGEDARYQALRRGWGGKEKQKMLIFFLQQGLAAWFFSLPYFIIFFHPLRFYGVWEIVGVVIWLIAFNGESISDAQLMTFKNDPKNQGKVCRVGLWKYSRHPNYFFEWLNWVAYAWLAMPHHGGSLAVLCPMLMYYLLNKVSGVPLAEKQALKSRSAEYLEYQRVTSSFFPWFPKKSEIF